MSFFDSFRSLGLQSGSVKLRARRPFFGSWFLLWSLFFAADCSHQQLAAALSSRMQLKTLEKPFKWLVWPIMWRQLSLARPCYGPSSGKSMHYGRNQLSTRPLPIDSGSGSRSERLPEIEMPLQLQQALRLRSHSHKSLAPEVCEPGAARESISGSYSVRVTQMLQ